MHEHIHRPNKNNKSNKRIVFTIILNFMICLAELIGGLLSGSLALLADALHNFSDGMAILISYLARKIGMRSPDSKMTFGYKRAEILAALLNSSVIIVISFSLFREAYFRFKNPQDITISLMLTVGVFGFFADLVSVYLLHPETHHNLNMRSAYLHLLGDTLSSVGVVVAGIIIYFYHFYFIDSLLTVIIGLFILIQGYQVLKQSTFILMERVPVQIDIEEIKKKIESIPQVNSLHHTHVWQIDEQKYLFESHITLKQDMKVSEADQIRKKVEEILASDFHISHPHLQLEFSYCNNQKCE
ncbi:MAG: cation diffusion facilitator family transporter [Atribacterota bacterium]|nr:cation diffusion facilitator family transporter [Atribacterota bacterium]MDD4897089.1 cation diffusion facilitator family transporter [Atribacterota bacterium]MDD5637869.1 cation diffusion facilitator family transporter [Atribacterota bacterium]